MRVDLTRRQTLAALAASGLVLGARAGNGPNVGVFGHGVASGDPDHESVLLWTRVAPVQPRMEVGWRIARDPELRQVVDEGTVVTGADRDHTVKVVAQGLEPGARYYFQFRGAGAESPTGRTRTLPRGPLEQLTLALASCSNYPFGHFNAYDAIARDAGVDFVVHLGDYIYEYGTDGYGGSVGAGLGRSHRPAYEILTLADYRERHAQYKSEPGSRAMHAAHPLIAIWDDHESANNPWKGGAQNHQPESEGRWVDRRAAALQAYFEWMPVRDPATGQDPASYWRHYRIGDLASLITLETRHTGRSRQIEYSAHLSDITSAEQAAAFMRGVLGAPGRTMFPAEQERFVAEALQESLEAGRPWRLIGNQIPMGRVHVPPLAGAGIAVDSGGPTDPVGEQLTHLITLGRYGLPLYLDTWDGYPEARERFYALCGSAGARDLLVLTGDSHAFWANRLFDAGGRSVGLELGTTGITSPGDFEGFGPEQAARLDRLLAEHNPEVDWTDNLHRGYLRLHLGREQGRADYVTVSRVDAPTYRTDLLHSVVIAREGDTLTYRR